MAHLEFEKPLVELEERIRELKVYGIRDRGMGGEIEKLEARVERLQEEIYDGLTVWQKVQLSRHPDRPYLSDYVERLFEDVVELHGDRTYGDDPAIISGFATFDGRSIAFVGHQKGRTTKEKVRRNFGMAHPEGYRKAMRVMDLAARFRRPILTFIDTPGAYPGIGAEERGQSEAIGASISLMSGLKTPIIATVIGEGGSGGALALGVANRVLMQEFATYSVITPEGCASILWHDGTLAPKAAEHLKLLATDALRLRVVDTVVGEPRGGAHRDYDDAAQSLRTALTIELAALDKKSDEALVSERYAKFRAMGEVHG
ncbi:MAG: acetyl-CoA carboxylase carboxyltransferase subunit alpha [Sandaracinaceae bacterium]